MGVVALVTGANQGLGFAVVQDLASRLGPDDIVYLTARSDERGRAALARLEKTRAEVRFAQLDVTDRGSIATIADRLARDHQGLDLVVSNAAARITKDRPQSEQARDFIATNNHGSRNLFAALEPLLRKMRDT